MKFGYWLLLFTIHFQVICQAQSTDSLLLELHKLHDDATKAKVCDQLFFEYVLKDNAQALRYLDSAISFAHKACDDNALGKFYNNKGAFLSLTGKSILAMQSLNEAMKYAEFAGDFITLLNIYGNVGNIYINRKENEKARFYFEKILASVDKTKDKDTYLTTLNNLAMIYGREKQHEEGLKILQMALELVEEETALQATMMNNIGFAHFKLGKYEKAMEYHEKAIALNKKLGNQYQLLASYLSVSELHLETKSFAKVIEAAKAALQIAEAEDYLEEIASANRFIANAYKETGEQTLALQFLEAHIKALNRFNDQLYSNEIAQLQEAFDVGIKEQEILNLRQNQDILAVLINRKSIQLMTGTVLIILLLILLGMGYHFFKTKEKVALALEKKNLKIETLIKELHHRVKNNLQLVNSLLSLQYSRTEDTETKQTLKEGQARLEAMALIHKNLSIDDDISGLNMQVYLESLTQNLTKSYGFPAESVQLSINLSNSVFDIDQAIPLGLIVNELISNAYKYAFANKDAAKLWLTLNEEKNLISFLIQDNGIGLADHDKIAQSQTFGLKLVTMLANQLNAQISIEVDNGTCFKLLFFKK
jgi:two-component system, sensor histidine kinase PdtaS